MLYILVSILGVFIGMLINVLLGRIPEEVGVLQIVHTDEGPYLYLELDEEVDSLYEKKCVSVRISSNTHE